MSTTYSDLIYTNYPDNIDSYEYMQDMTSDLSDLVSQYEKLIGSKRFNDAAQLLIENPSLNRIYFNAEKYNKLIDSIKAIQRLYNRDVQTYILELVKYLGNYSSSQKYTKYNVVNYNSMVYMCISLNCPLGTLPTNTTYWYPLSIKGDQGNPGLGLSFESQWQANYTYNKDSAVSYGTCLYTSSCDDNYGRTPSKTSDYWNLIIDFSDLLNYDNSSSGLNSVSYQTAIDELNINMNNNKNNISSNTNSINNINSRISNINNTPDSQKSVKNADTVDGVHFHPNDASGAPSGHGYVYGFKGGDDLNAWVYPTTQMSVKYADSSGTASTCSGNSATATTANYAHNAGNCDTVDGFHFKIGTNDLTAGSSSLTTNTFYFVYE